MKYLFQTAELCSLLKHCGMQVRHISLTQHLCSRRYLTLCKILYPLDLWWLSYKLLFVRQAQSSITPAGKPSHSRSCHLEASLPLTSDWQHSFSVFLSLQTSPLPVCSLFRAPAIFHRFQEWLLSLLSAC